MESPCTNHAYPVKHLYKDYELLKRFSDRPTDRRRERARRQWPRKGAWWARMQTTKGPYTATEMIQPGVYRLKDDNSDILTNIWNIE